MAKDLFHETVKTALIKDGWTILQDNYRLFIDEDLFFVVDILAEKFLIAQKAKRVIIVEVKSFARRSATYEFHSAIGQYITYRTIFEYLKLERELFLAIPLIAYEGIFQHPFITFLIEKYDIRLLPFNPDKKVLVK